MDRDILQQSENLVKRVVALKQFEKLTGAQITQSDKADVLKEVSDLQKNVPPVKLDIEPKPNTKPEKKKYRSIGS